MLYEVITAPAIDSYLTLDARLGWKPRRNLELALVGQNLLVGQHVITSYSIHYTKLYDAVKRRGRFDIEFCGLSRSFKNERFILLCCRKVPHEPLEHQR